MREEDAVIESSRCLNCNNPSCVRGCPLEINIPKFINHVKNMEYEKAYSEINKKSYFGSVCGRVCPKEKQCQGNCIRGIKEEPVQIGKLEAFVCDLVLKGKMKIEKNIIESNNMKVAIIGAGPAGLTAAVELKKKGYDVTIFEKGDVLGGILKTTLPEYRLPKGIIDNIVRGIIDLKINVKKNICLGKDFECRDLFEDGYRAIFLSIGNTVPRKLNIEGVNLKNIYGAIDFLKNINKYDFKNVVVVGGGNVAVDTARSLARKKINVTLIYRRRLENMSASRLEINEAINEKVKFVFERNVIKISGNQKVESVTLDDGYVLNCDSVIMAIGSIPDKEILEGVNLNENGLVSVNDNYETSLENVFAGGDLIDNKATVCMAIKSGISAASAIDQKIKGE